MHLYFMYFRILLILNFLQSNVQATQDELKVAYRRLCMLYHPDKHRDPELKRQAEQLFNLVHEAYEGWKRSFLSHMKLPFKTLYIVFFSTPARS